MAGGSPPRHQGQPRRTGGGEVGMGEGEAVDRDVVEARHVAIAREQHDPFVGVASGTPRFQKLRDATWRRYRGD